MPIVPLVLGALFMRVSIVLALLSSSAQAWAQGTPDTEMLPGEVLEAVEIRPTPLFSEGWTWRALASDPTPRDGIQSLGGLGGTTGQLFALDANGGFWKSEDEGVSWFRVLAGVNLLDDPQSDETILLEAESLAEDFLGEALEAELDPDALDEEILEELGRIQESTDTLAIQDLIDQENVSEGHAAQSIWIHPEIPEIVLLSRADGLWRSNDEGESFALIDPEIAFNDVGATTRGLLLGATDNGMVYSLDQGFSWIQTTDELSGLHCKDLLWTGTYWLLATERVGE